MDVITCPCWELIYSMLVKGDTAANIVIAEDLLMQRTGASADMLLTKIWDPFY